MSGVRSFSFTPLSSLLPLSFLFPFPSFPLFPLLLLFVPLPPLVLHDIVNLTVGAERAENLVERSGAVSALDRKKRSGSGARSGGRGEGTERGAGITEIVWSAKRLFGRSCSERNNGPFFSERELMFTFAYVVVRPSVVCLWSVCNVRAPYSAD